MQHCERPLGEMERRVSTKQYLGDQWDKDLLALTKPTEPSRHVDLQVLVQYQEQPLSP